MKSVLIFFTVAISAVSAQGKPDSEAEIIRYENEGVDPQGSYKWLYETSNDINAEESGYVKNLGKEGEEAQVAEGKFSYKSPEGEIFTITYIADENGFQPQGAHLPTPPPIPEAILKALEYLKTLPPNPEDAQATNIRPQIHKPRGRF